MKYLILIALSFTLINFTSCFRKEIQRNEINNKIEIEDNEYPRLLIDTVALDSIL